MAKGGFKLARIKFNALELLKRHQLPLYLVHLINNLTGNENDAYIRCLMQFSEFYCRVRGFYKKYPDIEKSVTEEIKNNLISLGF